ncbi:MAG: family NAD(P)-dependent oxidoreductase [Marmoricola sp.]|nr:family NAD(P)-dependent oxidoreductase [Marmoricola sp.]
MSTQVAVVIGGASGLGTAIARALHAEGHTVTVADANLAGAEAVAAACGGTPVAADVTDEAAIESLFTEVLARSGSVDIVVNTAGTSGFSAIADHDVAEWRSVVDVNLVGAMIVIKHAARVMGRGGSILSLTSLNARQPGAGLSAYCAAKAGLSMLTAVAALELGPRGIRVNAIAPGLVITPLTEGIQMVPGVQEDYVENTPLGRAGTPEEIADAAVYLSSERAAWITGEVLDINGGAHLMRYPNIGKHLDAMMNGATP